MKHIFLNLMVILDIMLRVHLQILGKCKKVPWHKISKALLSALLPLPRRIQRALLTGDMTLNMEIHCCGPTMCWAIIYSISYSKHSRGGLFPSYVKGDWCLEKSKEMFQRYMPCE